MTAILLFFACAGSAVGGAHLGWRFKGVFDREVAKQGVYCGTCDRPLCEVPDRNKVYDPDEMQSLIAEGSEVFRKMREAGRS